ncbi:MAG: type VI secretion protein IcmF [Ramlibacter sp.]|nr:type VI secretion protein IcmF [Ramlibacter sp.]MBX3660543.1 type VI secretion protein IcmF [Ramlibacter sp.]
MLRDNLFLLSLGVLIVLVLVVLGLVLYFAVRRSTTKASSDPKIARLRFDSLRSSFRQAVELIEQNIASRSERYSIPWVMVLNEGSRQHQLPIEQSGVASALSSEAAMAATAQGLSWHFFDRGVVIDIQGAYLGSPDDEDAAEKPWDEFLGLCRKYRPQRPFDSVVITVPASLLLDDNPDARLELGKLAKLAHRRLWLAQNRFAMRFAVYVVVSECEEIEGFAQFARAVPDSVRASMLGWSSPFDLSTTYQSAWVRDGVDAVVRTVSDTSAELFALNTAAEDAGKFFLLPSRIEKIKSQLQLYVDELMRPSAYHEPFFFRGIYLTGDSSESAQKALAMDTGAAVDGAGLDGGGDLVSQLMREPAFLRDLFEKKIFLEYGLARPSRQQLSRPVLSRAMRWAAIIVLGTWSIGLVVATVQLDSRHTELARALEQLQADANYRARAAERGEIIPTEWYRRKAVALLAAIEKLGVDTPWTIFMPGSWHMFDDLEERAGERIEREFGEIAINTLRRELYSRASELTGVSQDSSTAELIIGGECNVPAGIAAIAGTPRRPTLAVEDLPEFAAMLQYLTSVEQLDQATQAMLRLQKPSQNEANDLRLLVKYALGAELPGNISRSVLFFRGGPATLSLTPVQQATRCTLGKGMSALEARLFVNNDLLLSEQRLGKLSAKLFMADGVPVGYTQTVDAYREVLAAIKEQEVLLASGKGGWMRQPFLNLGPAYDRFMVRIAQVRLLGPDVADQSRLQTALAFQRFSADFSSRIGGEGQGGITWLDKEARFALSSDRVALRDALSGLLNQPFMTNPRDQELPDVASSQASLVWDTQRLDQALALGDVRKRYLTEGLPKFPPAVRPGIETFVNAQFARLVNDQVNEALSVTARMEPGAAADIASFDASRSRLIKVQALLAELGARGRADNLRGLISRDAIARLRYVDESLSRSELYSIRGRDFKGWNGEKGPLLQAFGVQDVAGMQQYLAQQFNRADTLDKLAESYIASLDLPAPGPITLRWQAIHRDLERYRLKNPNSSLVLLEQFLLTLGPELDRFNCSEKLAGKGPGSRAVDYFGERYQHIYTSLLSRCGELKARDQQEQWAQFAGNFNRTVAGRLPFSQSVSRDVLPADFDEVGQLIKSFDRAARTLKDITSDVGVRNTQQALSAKRFVDQFERAKAFLQPLYPAEDGAASGYDVAVEFRANQQAEIDGNKVIDWTLEIGGQVLRLRDGPKVLKWEPGTPVTLTLRLAKDSPLTPVQDPQQPALLADGKAVIFRYTDPWALVTMIQRQREPDGALRADSRSQLLRMDFPLVNVSGNDPRTQGIEARSRVYLRLTLSAVGKKTPVAWPGIFPVRAPEWNRP